MTNLLNALQEWVLDCDIILALEHRPQKELLKRVESLRRRIAQTLELQQGPPITNTDNLVHDELCALVLGEGECDCNVAEIKRLRGLME